MALLFQNLSHSIQWFISKLPDWWKEGAQGTSAKSAVLTFTAKLRHCRQRIKEWCASEFYSIRRLKNFLMDEIQSIDKAEELGDLTLDLQSKRAELKKKLSGVLNDEASVWRTRAKQH